MQSSQLLSCCIFVVRVCVLQTQMYHQSVVPMLQQLVDSWIMTTEGGTFAAPPVVHLTDFPNPTYTEDGFWSGRR